MSIAVITIKDDPDNYQGIIVEADFGDAVDPASVAHGTATELLQAVLGQAKRIDTLEDTTGDAPISKAESLIIKPG